MYFRLTEDIDLSGHSWEPIGNSAQSFLGVFDGNGHTISGLYIDAPDEDNQGLFGYLGDDETASAEVKNIGIVNSFIRCWAPCKWSVLHYKGGRSCFII